MLFFLYFRYVMFYVFISSCAYIQVLSSAGSGFYELTNPTRLDIQKEGP